MLGGCRNQREGGRGEDGAEGLLGRCQAMRRLSGDLQVAAGSDVAVHVHGETGTGKERVAQALHTLSARRERAFVPVNAASLSDELFEATLFGHVRGAFTGAATDRPGLVLAAEGGTLFLDEVSELSPLGQARLLRFLQEREYRRVGETHQRRADVRIVTAANACLRERVAANAFREDLFYRLGTVALLLPPLRERGEDIEVLARHFLDVAARREGRRPLRLSPEVRRALLGYAWPGNVRELEAEMARATVFGRDDAVRLDDLGFALREAIQERPRTLRGVLAWHERRELARALEAHAGNRTRAARALGITRQALYSKLRRFGLAEA